MSDNSVAKEQLISAVERIEKLEEENKSTADDIRDIYAEAKGNGFDAKILREVIKRRKIERSLLESADNLRDLYEHALGMNPDSSASGEG